MKSDGKRYRLITNDNKATQNDEKCILAKYPKQKVPDKKLMPGIGHKEAHRCDMRPNAAKRPFIV